MSQSPKFTIITITFNAGALFDRTLESVRAQTFRDFEWLVIDGASKDDTVSRIKAAGSDISCWISERDKGISDAWNKGLALAKGDYVLLLNAGDIYARTFLEEIAKTSSKLSSHDQIICADAELRSEDGKLLKTFRARPDKLYRGMHVPHNWCAVPRHFYVALGGYSNLSVAGDFRWFHSYYKKYGRQGFVVIPQVMGAYFLGGKSDEEFVAAFRQQESVVVDLGMNRIQARFIRLAYTVKHAVNKYLVW